MRCFQVIIFLQLERYYFNEVCYQTNQTQCQFHAVIKRNRATLTSDIININLNESSVFHVSGILYFKITHCYQVNFDVIKALPYILSFALLYCNFP